MRIWFKIEPERLRRARNHAPNDYRASSCDGECYSMPSDSSCRESYQFSTSHRLHETYYVHLSTDQHHDVKRSFCLDVVDALLMIAKR